MPSIRTKILIGLATVSALAVASILFVDRPETIVVSDDVTLGGTYSAPFYGRYPVFLNGFGSTGNTRSFGSARSMKGSIQFLLCGTPDNFTITSIGSYWTNLASSTANSDKYWLYYYVSTSTQVMSHSITFSGSGRNGCWITGQDTNAFDLTNPIQSVSNVEYRTSNNQVVSGAATSTRAGGVLLFFGFAANTLSVGWTPPSGMTELHDNGGTAPDIWTTSAYQIFNATGTTGTKAATMSRTGTAKHGILVLLNPRGDYFVTASSTTANNTEFSTSTPTLTFIATTTPTTDELVFQIAITSTTSSSSAVTAEAPFINGYHYFLSTSATSNPSWIYLRNNITSIAGTLGTASEIVGSDYNYRVANQYSITRLSTTMPFLDSVLPEGATLVGVDLNMYVTNVVNTENDGDDLIFANAIEKEYVWNANCLAVTDATCTWLATSTEIYDISDISAGQWLKFSFGWDAVTKFATDTSKLFSFRVLEGHDYRDSTPTGANLVTFAGSATTTSAYKPYLRYHYVFGGEEYTATSTMDGFFNAASSTDTSPFANNTEISFKVPLVDALANGTYLWHVRAQNASTMAGWTRYTQDQTFTVNYTPPAEGGGSTVRQSEFYFQ